MHERQLDGIGDLLDLCVEASHIFVGHIGHLFEDEVLDLGPGQPFENDAGPGVDQECVAAAKGLGPHELSHFDDPLLVGPADDQGPVAALQQLLQSRHLTGAVGVAGEYDVERFVEHDLLAQLELISQFGLHGDAHLASPGVDVDRAVVVGAENGSVAGGRLGQRVDLVAQRRDVLAGLAQRVGELLILRDGLAELALRLEQALLEGADTLGRVLQPAAQRGDLVLELRGDHAESVDLDVGVLVLHGCSILVGCGSPAGPRSRAP